MNLTALGFNTYFEEQMIEYKKQTKLVNCVPARVTLEHKHSYRVLAEEGEWLATVAGHFAYTSLAREDFPAVGDWVLVEKMPGEEKAIIHQLFKRKSVFSRKVAGQEIQEQIVASNVDIVLLVMSLNADFNIRRLERYLIAAWDSGAKPIIVLTKADLCANVSDKVRDVESVAFGVDIFVTSAYSGEGLMDIRALFTDGVTGALLGSSGAGKSTLTNMLSGEELMKVSDIRDDDAKGRHTTTHRELVVLPEGGCLIDTPGMRELQLWDQGDSLASSFQDIEQLSAVCHYRDCTHQKEPHCAVQQAIADGELEESRLQSYFKLQKELAFIERKTNTQARLNEQRKWKQIAKGLKKGKKK
ncbi:ribosome small subunit-dependent GTPase A [Lysinibacillus pakistanensis]|uniref:Small ribosomal subunit biogenesis GTPase RsgA n=1 Tax=Lysinibacillus pakistanensis TaxID=759811 RepID=A0AAX3WVZ2_9BACI|nr:ribosome small subunit-dependent GTPase A [Lysinibacillus pakistanensis]MDM5230744.1 ribosome small subunit-dependent GTPase A [Lysinibacillus pakistanensis]WHY46315.1 ribosome small subunit-dependent GTPase A [Lysinibacillus pakistanensis]WHY51327.1 ribosome small subunit-dependent GTPase A [Lysinibacillus pakistanensis]